MIATRSSPPPAGRLADGGVLLPLLLLLLLGSRAWPMVMGATQSWRLAGRTGAAAIAAAWRGRRRARRGRRRAPLVAAAAASSPADRSTVYQPPMTHQNGRIGGRDQSNGVRIPSNWLWGAWYHLALDGPYAIALPRWLLLQCRGVACVFVIWMAPSSKRCASWAFERFASHTNQPKPSNPLSKITGHPPLDGYPISGSCRPIPPSQHRHLIHPIAPIPHPHT